MTAMPRARVFVLFAACAVLIALVVTWYQLPFDSAAREGWKSVDHEGVRIDIPDDWERLDTSECEFQFEQWAPSSDSLPCDFEGGAAFFGSATFDPAHGPGVRRTTENGTPTWGGYVLVDDFAVFASSSDRDVVEEVLDSARLTK